MNENAGDPKVQVMSLVTQLEGKVRDKNDIIKALEDESRNWRTKFVLMQMFGIGHPMMVGVVPWGVGLLMGILVGVGVAWLKMRHL